VLFERDLLPGYAWVFPLPGGRANVGFGVLRAGADAAALRRLWPDLLAREPMRAALGPLAEPEDRHRAWPIPSVYSPARLADGRVLYAGDAAGVVDPMTGEGIAQAIESGALAAAAIAAGGGPPLVAARYRAAVHRTLGRDLRFAAALQRLLGSPRATAAAIRMAGLTPWTRRHFARWMFEDYPRAALFTPDRWRRRLLTPAGAFGSAR
jgi:flavin-dependent dehydrogenase